MCGHLPTSRNYGSRCGPMLSDRRLCTQSDQCVLTQPVNMLFYPLCFPRGHYVKLKRVIWIANYRGCVWYRTRAKFSALTLFPILLSEAMTQATCVCWCPAAVIEFTLVSEGHSLFNRGSSVVRRLFLVFWRGNNFQYLQV